MGYGGRHNRRSIRLRGYDYTRDGSYFVTLCVRNRAVCVRVRAVRVRAVREPPVLFGTVADGEMRLNEYGREVAACWVWLEERHPYVHLDQWVVMPDHLHGIVVIEGGSVVSTKRKPLGRLIGAFKNVSTRRINDMRSTPGAKLWQRGYYEHIVRDDGSLRRIREYIANNPSRWALDLREWGRGWR